MSTTTEAKGQPLQAEKFPYGPHDKFTVTDAEGTVVREGDICRVIEPTTWLKVDAIVKATGQATFDGDGGIYYLDTTLSLSAIRKSAFVVVTDDSTRVEYELAVAWHRKAELTERVAQATDELHRVEREIDRLQQLQ